MGAHGFQYSQFAYQCSIIRNRLNLSVPALSRLSGVSATMIYYFEGGQRTLSDELCRKIVQGLIKGIDARQREDEKEAARIARLREQKQKDRQAMMQELTNISTLLTTVGQELEPA